MKFCMLAAAPALLFASGTGAFSQLSSFTRSFTVQHAAVSSGGGLVMYDSSRDPPSEASGGKSNKNNMWSVLATTEKWIAGVLGDEKQSNPYTRKEVNYVCELGDEDALVTAGIWRRLKEAREFGVSHGRTQEEMIMEQGPSYSPKTFRQTLVVVIPNNDAISQKFSVFNELVTQINQARRNARDFVTDLSLEKLEAESSGDAEERDWSVSVNCAHLHPKFGEKSSKQILKEMMEEEEAGEIDVNLQNYKRKKELARRSPYPTVVIEVLATPPPDSFAPPPPAQETEPQVTGDDVRKLEALFGKSAAFDHPSRDMTEDEQEDAFYDSIANSIGIQEITLFTPIILAQNWIAAHDDYFHSKTSTFTHCETQFVDEAFEFAFNNIAMQASKPAKPVGEGESGPRQYLVFSKLVSTSATSFEKFCMMLRSMIRVLPSVADRVELETYHPEHIDSARRSPYPVMVLAWKK